MNSGFHLTSPLSEEPIQMDFERAQEFYRVFPALGFRDSMLVFFFCRADIFPKKIEMKSMKQYSYDYSISSSDSNVGLCFFMERRGIGLKSSLIAPFFLSIG